MNLIQVISEDTHYKRARKRKREWEEEKGREEKRREEVGREEEGGKYIGDELESSMGKDGLSPSR